MEEGDGNGDREDEKLSRSVSKPTRVRTVSTHVGSKV